MPVFRSKVRRRPPRVAPRRRTSTRWAPPGISPASGVTLDLATFGDTFSETTLKPWWRDSDVIRPTASKSPVVTAGTGLTFNPTAGTYTEVFGAYPFDLTAKSVTFDINIAPGMLTDPSVYIELSLIPWPWAAGITGTAVLVAFYYSGTDYLFDVWLNNGGTQQTFVVTSTAGWRFIRVTSDILTPSTVTVYRSPDGYVWTTVLSATVNAVDITALTFYAIGQTNQHPAPAGAAVATGTAHNATATAT